MTLRRLTLVAVLVMALAGVLRALQGGPPRGYWGDGVRRWEGEGRPGREKGEWSYWYENGQLRERGRYSAFHRVGEWSQWHANGQRASVGERVWSEEQNASVRHGAWTTWHENGDKASEGVYQFGARTGPWSYWRVVGDRAVLDEARSGRYEADRKVE